MWRSDRYPVRIRSWDWGDRGRSSVDATMAAVSRMQPAAVIQLLPGCGERKKTRAGFDVWLYSMSANHASHWASSVSICGSNPMMW